MQGRSREYFKAIQVLTDSQLKQKEEQERKLYALECIYVYSSQLLGWGFLLFLFCIWRKKNQVKTKHFQRVLKNTTSCFLGYILYRYSYLQSCNFYISLVCIRVWLWLNHPLFYFFGIGVNILEFLFEIWIEMNLL